MTILHLGVLELQYVQAPPKPKKPVKGKRRPIKRRKGTAGLITTGDVAEILETKYGVMQAFFDAHSTEIADAMAESLAGSLENLLLGAPPDPNPFATVEGTIKKLFSTAILSKEFDNLLPDVPTAASLRGVSKRFKLKRGPVRPSFYDSGIYENSFIAWFT